MREFGREPNILPIELPWREVLQQFPGEFPKMWEMLGEMSEVGEETSEEMEEEEEVALR